MEYCEFDRAVGCRLPFGSSVNKVNAIVTLNTRATI
jgi:hypothetical protein